MDGNSFGAFEAKTHFSELLKRAEKGETITITKHGRPVAKLVPFNDADAVRRRKEAWAAWDRQPNPPTLGDNLTIKDLINEGRE
jgi:prevent-host-death family protein